MRKPLNVVAVALLAVGTTLLVLNFMGPRSGVGQKTDQPAFERVSKSRTIRCSYSTWRPFIFVDPTSGKVQGIDAEIMEQVGKMMDMKIIWTEEVGMSQIAENLNSGRSDVQCLTEWPSGNRAMNLDFTMAVDYIGAYAMVRANDHRFDGNLAAINSPQVTVAVVDGDFTQAIPNEDFPQARQMAIGQDSDGSQLLLAVATGKADVAFVDPFLMHEFDKANPGKVRRVSGVPPVRIFGDEFALAKGETKLRDAINVPLRLMNQSGFIRKTMDKWLGEYKGEYFYPAQPYEK